MENSQKQRNAIPRPPEAAIVLIYSQQDNEDLSPTPTENFI